MVCRLSFHAFLCSLLRDMAEYYIQFLPSLRENRPSMLMKNLREARLHCNVAAWPKTGFFGSCFLVRVFGTRFLVHGKGPRKQLPKSSFSATLSQVHRYMRLGGLRCRQACRSSRRLPRQRSHCPKLWLVLSRVAWPQGLKTSNPSNLLSTSAL